MTSVRSAADLQSGDHACLLYDATDDRLRAVVQFVRDGLLHGDRVVYIADGDTRDVVRLLEADGLDTAAYRASGQLAFVRADEHYLEGGRFDPDRVFAKLWEASARAEQDGVTLRATGEMSWALRGTPGSERLLGYERLLQQDFPGNLIVLCQYDTQLYHRHGLEELAAAHPVVVSTAEPRPNGGRRQAVQPAGGGVIRLVGVVDAASFDTLARTVSAALREPRDLVVDMSRLVFIDVAALRVLYHAALNLAPRGLSVTLTSPPEPITKMLELLEWQEYLRSEPRSTVID